MCQESLKDFNKQNSQYHWLPMNTRTIAKVLSPLMAVGAAAQQREGSGSISVRFAVDGKAVACGDLRVELRLADSTIVPDRTDDGFAVPAAFKKEASAWTSDDKVDVSVGCGQYTLSFPKLHPTWVSPGRWELGIAYPPYAIERFKGTGALEQGAWLSYLVSECNGCDPGLVVTTSHADPPPAVLARLRREQPRASGESARDIAYALAVFGTGYRQNRDYLVEVLNSCLSRPRESPKDAVCNGRLLDYVTNLYWRGDTGLLGPLLHCADSRGDVVDEVGTFYADLLDRHASAALQGMQELPVAKQRIICSLAGEDGFRVDPPKLERVAQHFHALGGDVADRCLQEAERTAERVSQ